MEPSRVRRVQQARTAAEGAEQEEIRQGLQAQVETVVLAENGMQHTVLEVEAVGVDLPPRLGALAGAERSTAAAAEAAGFPAELRE